MVVVVEQDDRPRAVGAEQIGLGQLHGKDDRALLSAFLQVEIDLDLESGAVIGQEFRPGRAVVDTDGLLDPDVAALDAERTDAGLSKFGLAVIKRMNAIIDEMEALLAAK